MIKIYKIIVFFAFISIIANYCRAKQDYFLEDFYQLLGTDSIIHNCIPFEEEYFGEINGCSNCNYRCFLADSTTFYGVPIESMYIIYDTSNNSILKINLYVQPKYYFINYILYPKFGPNIFELRRLISDEYISKLKKIKEENIIKLGLKTEDEIQKYIFSTDSIYYRRIRNYTYFDSTDAQAFVLWNDKYKFEDYGIFIHNQTAMDRKLYEKGGIYEHSIYKPGFYETILISLTRSKDVYKLYNIGYERSKKKIELNKNNSNSNIINLGTIQAGKDSLNTNAIKDSILNFIQKK